MGFTIYTFNVLNHAHFKYVSEIVERYNEGTLMNVRNLGQRTYNEIVKTKRKTTYIMGVKVWHSLLFRHLLKLQKNTKGI